MVVSFSACGTFPERRNRTSLSSLPSSGSRYDAAWQPQFLLLTRLSANQSPWRRCRTPEHRVPRSDPSIQHGQRRMKALLVASFSRMEQHTSLGRRAWNVAGSRLHHSCHERPRQPQTERDRRAWTSSTRGSTSRWLESAFRWAVFRWKRLEQLREAVGPRFPARGTDRL